MPSPTSEPAVEPHIRAIVFDMDGTLLSPIEDGLDAFKLKWAIPPSSLVVPSLAQLPPEATAEFIALEARVAAESHVRPGIVELLRDLARAGVAVGLVTNNSFESVNTVLTKHELAFPVVKTRADGPMKPEPDLVLAALELMEVEPAQALFVGDTAADAGAARAAGLAGCLLFAEPWNAAFEGELRRVAGAADLRRALVAAGAPEALLEVAPADH